MSLYQARAAACRAKAEAATDPRDRRAFEAAAWMWDYLSKPLKAATPRGVQLDAQRAERIEAQQVPVGDANATAIDPARVTPTSRYHVTGVQPVAIEF